MMTSAPVRTRRRWPKGEFYEKIEATSVTVRPVAVTVPRHLRSRTTTIARSARRI